MGDFDGELHQTEVMTLTMSVSASQAKSPTGQVHYPLADTPEAFAATGALLMTGTLIKWEQGASEVPSTMLVVTGPPSALQTALSSLQYIPPTDFAGVNVLSISLSDLGYYSGAMQVSHGVLTMGPPLVAEKRIPIIVLSEDDPAVVSAVEAMKAQAHVPTSLADKVVLTDPDVDDSLYLLNASCQYCHWDVQQDALEQRGVFVVRMEEGQDEDNSQLHGSRLQLKGSFPRLQTVLQFVAYKSFSSLPVVDAVELTLQKREEMVGVSLVVEAFVSTAVLVVEVESNTIPPTLLGKSFLQLREDDVVGLPPVVFQYDLSLSASACDIEVRYDARNMALRENVTRVCRPCLNERWISISAQ